MNYKNKVAIYLRKSRMDPDDEDINETLARHESELIKTAKLQNLNIVDIKKEVVSGDGLFTRPKMLELLSEVEEQKYTAVLCMAIDRLGRSSQKDEGIILETLKNNNIIIITPQKTYDLNEDLDETMVEMQAFLARQELKLIKRRLSAGVRKSVEEGCHVAEPPFGYRRAYLDKKPTLAIEQSEAEIVKMIFSLYNDGLGSSSIADKLNNMGLSPRKKSTWSRNSVRYLLSNPVYTGKIYHNRTRHLRPNGNTTKYRQVKNSVDKWIVSNGLHEAIISEEIFEQAQKIRQTRTHPPSYTGKLKNPYAGLVYCRNCGTAIVRHCCKSIVELMCPEKACTRSIGFQYFDAQIKVALEQVLINIKNIPNITASHNNQRDSIKLAISKLTKELETLKLQRGNLHNLLEQGVYDSQTFVERNRIISEREIIIESELDTFREQLQTKRVDAIDFVPLIEDCVKNFDIMSVQEKNKALKTFIKKIIYSHDADQNRTECSISIEFKFDF